MQLNSNSEKKCLECVAEQVNKVGIALPDSTIIWTNRLSHPHSRSGIREDSPIPAKPQEQKYRTDAMVSMAVSVPQVSCVVATLQGTRKRVLTAVPRDNDQWHLEWVRRHDSVTSYHTGEPRALTFLCWRNGYCAKGYSLFTEPRIHMDGILFWHRATGSWPGTHLLIKDDLEFFFFFWPPKCWD